MPHILKQLKNTSILLLLVCICLTSLKTIAISNIEKESSSKELDLSQIAREEVSATIPILKDKKQNKIAPELNQENIQQISILRQQNEYVPKKARDYDFSFRADFEQTSFMGIPQNQIIGAQNLQELGSLPTVQLQIGMSQFSKSKFWRWGFFIFGGYGATEYQTQDQSGRSIRPRVHLIDSGLGAEAAYSFTSKLSLRAATLLGQLRLTQSSTQTSFADWTESGRLNSNRIGVFYAFPNKGDSFDLGLEIMQSNLYGSAVELDNDLKWAISSGVRW